MPAPIIIRESLAGQLSSIAVTILCLTTISYTWVTMPFSFVNLLVTIAVLVFIFSTLKKVIERKIQIALSEEGIVLEEDRLIKWEEIKDVFLDTRWLDTGVRGRKRKLTYLNIEPVFSGQFSGQRVIRSIMVSGMEMRPAIIMHHVHAFRRWHSLSASIHK